MRYITVLTLVALLCGCAVTTKRFYVPTDPQLAYEGTSCGFVPYGGARIPIEQLVTLSINMGPNQGTVSLALQFSLATGQSLRFVSPEMTLFDPTTGRSATTVLGPFQVPVYGREGRPGAHELFPSSAVLKGIGRNSALATDTTRYLLEDQFTSQAEFQFPAANPLLLRFPAVEVNGRIFGERTIEFNLIEKTGVVLCM